jgi:hypothetical protein
MPLWQNPLMQGVQRANEQSSGKIKGKGQGQGK